MRIVALSVVSAVCTFAMLQASVVGVTQTSVTARPPVVDLPSLVGKSTEEMEELFGEHTLSYYGSHLEWFCRCEEARRYKVKVGWGLWVGYRGNRAVSFSYSLGPKNPEPETPGEMLKIVGLDVRGIPPSQAAQTPMAGASSGPFGGLIGGKNNYLLWTGEVSGVEWSFILVGGSESRGSGSTMFRPKNWRIKRRYYQVMANAAESL